MNACDIIVSIAIVVLTISVLIWSLKELMIGSIVLYKFFLAPWIHNSQGRPWLWSDNSHYNYVYMLTFLAILFSIIGSICIYQTLICSSYFDGCKLFQVAFMLSISCSVSILVLNHSVGYDTYEHYIERDMYIKVSSLGDYQCDRYNCYKTQVYFMHQERRCCGWHSPDELTLWNSFNQFKEQDVAYASDSSPDLLQSSEVVFRSDQLSRYKLPLFCCARIPNAIPQCSLNSTNLFRKTCRAHSSEFWRISNVDPSVVNPTTFFSLVLKFILVYGYAIGRREMLLPTSDSRFVDPTSAGRN